MYSSGVVWCFDVYCYYKVTTMSLSLFTSDGIQKRLSYRPQFQKIIGAIAAKSSRVASTFAVQCALISQMESWNVR